MSRSSNSTREWAGSSSCDGTSRYGDVVVRAPFAPCIPTLLLSATVLRDCLWTFALELLGLPFLETKDYGEGDFRRESTHLRPLSPEQISQIGNDVRMRMSLVG